MHSQGPTPNPLPENSRVPQPRLPGATYTHPVKKEAPGQHGGTGEAEGWRETQQAAAELQEAFIGELRQLQPAAQQLHLGETRALIWLCWATSPAGNRKGKNMRGDRAGRAVVGGTRAKK